MLLRYYNGQHRHWRRLSEMCEKTSRLSRCSKIWSGGWPHDCCQRYSTHLLHCELNISMLHRLRQQRIGGQLLCISAQCILCSVSGADNHAPFCQKVQVRIQLYLDTSAGTRIWRLRARLMML